MASIANQPFIFFSFQIHFINQQEQRKKKPENSNQKSIKNFIFE